MSTFVLCVGCGEPLYGFLPCRWCTCERCGIDMLNGICPLCHLSNSCAYDHNQNSFDCPPDSYHPPHPTYETYSGDTRGNDSHFGYDCPPHFPLNYEPEPGYIQNYNSYPHDSSSFPQQYPCCEDCGVTHKPYQCQPRNEDYYHEQNSCYDSNSIGFDQSQPQQYTVNHPIFNAHNDVLTSQTTIVEQMTQLKPMVEMFCQFVLKKREENDNQSLSDEDVPKKIYSNPLFDEEIIPMEIDPHSFNAESDLIKSMPNHDSSIIISSKIDSLFDEFIGELTPLKSFPPGTDETDCHPEKEICLTKRLLYDNSSPRPQEEIVSDNSNADIESFSPSHIPNKD
nr:pre-mRNA splicing Prp18-interacting factor [Tanacetum cinerariifolium]